MSIHGSETEETPPTTATSTSTYTVLIGPIKTAYTIDRSLLSRIPYFTSLFSFTNAASTTQESHSVHLDAEADTDEAFRMILQFLRHGRYRPPGYYDAIGHAMVHACVYAMADRLMLLELKEIGARNLLMSLSQYRTAARNTLFTPPQGKAAGLVSVFGYAEGGAESATTTLPRWNTYSVPEVDGDCVARILDMVYIAGASSPAGEEIKKVVLRFASQDAVLRELAVSAEYAEVLGGNEEMRMDMEVAVRSRVAGNSSWTFDTAACELQASKLEFPRKK